MDLIITSSAPIVCQYSADLNLSFYCPHDPNSTAHLLNSSNFSLSYFTMTFGILSNLTGLAILSASYARFQRRAKTPFLLLAASLLLTDLVGHLVTGAFALHLHLEKIKKPRSTTRSSEPPPTFCKLFGACMVYFGLSPLLLGSAMAVERCVGIIQPLQHSAVATMAHVRLAIVLIITLACTLAALPLLNVGTYKPQFPGTWCFLPVNGPLSTADACVALVFSSLGFTALTVSLFCNTVSGLVLLQARLSNKGQKSTDTRRHKSSSASSLHLLDVEMMVQLVVITVVSCVCWSPFLIYISLSVRQFYKGNNHNDQHYEQLLLLGLRMASWNQILDPWVYILLRRAVLRRVCALLQPNGIILTQSSSCTSSDGRK